LQEVEGAEEAEGAEEVEGAEEEGDNRMIDLWEVGVVGLMKLNMATMDCY